MSDNSYPASWYRPQPHLKPEVESYISQLTDDELADLLARTRVPKDQQ